MVTSVLIVEDNPDFMRLFSDAVLADPQLHLIGAVSTGRAALALLDVQMPDVLLVDLGLPDIDGTEVIRHGTRNGAGCDALVVTMFAQDERVQAAIEAGASGYLLKDASGARITAAIHELRAGGSPLCPRIARQIFGRLRGLVTPPPNRPAGAPTNNSPLTAREGEILRLAAKGLGFETIGDLLEISPHTVVAHVKKIYRKLAVHSRGEAVYEARQMGWL